MVNEKANLFQEFLVIGPDESMLTQGEHAGEFFVNPETKFTFKKPK